MNGRQLVLGFPSNSLLVLWFATDLLTPWTTESFRESPLLHSVSPLTRKKVDEPVQASLLSHAEYQSLRSPSLSLLAVRLKRKELNKFFFVSNRSQIREQWWRHHRRQKTHPHASRQPAYTHSNFQSALPAPLDNNRHPLTRAWCIDLSAKKQLWWFAKMFCCQRTRFCAVLFIQLPTSVLAWKSKGAETAKNTRKIYFPYQQEQPGRRG